MEEMKKQRATWQGTWEHKGNPGKERTEERVRTYIYSYPSIYTHSIPQISRKSTSASSHGAN